MKPRLVASGVLLLASARALAAVGPLSACAPIESDRERLACYDAIARAASPPAATPAAPAATATPPVPPVAAPAEASWLERQWELRPDLQRGVLVPQAHRPLYALAHATTRINSAPSSPSRALSSTDIDLERVEAKLQLSFKSKLWQDILATPADLWFTYTQQSYWQAANGRFSSPFRETNYEPEIVAVYPLHLDFGGVHARYAGLSVTHQSNGRGESLSRSWNRVIGELALEEGPWSLRVRPWWRIAEPNATRNDNPDIEDYVGRGELIAAYRSGRQVVTFTGRHSLRGGDRSRGSAQLDWAFPLTGGLDGHVQLFSGYGESLIDYNFRQTTVGFGLSFLD